MSAGERAAAAQMKDRNSSNLSAEQGDNQGATGAERLQSVSDSEQT